MKVIGMDKKNLVVKTKLTTEVFHTINSLPSSSKWVGRDIHIKPIMSNIKHLLDNFPNIEWSDDTRHFYDDYVKAKEKEFELLVLKDSDSKLPTDYDFKRLPMDHQGKGFTLSRDEINFAYLMDPGTGKTKLTIDVAAYLYLKNKIDAFVVVAWPNGVHRVWTDHEMALDCPIEYQSLAWNAKRSKKRLKQVGDFCAKDNVSEYTRPPFKLISFNAEAFASELAKDFIIDFMTNRRCMLVIDQSASIKNYQAKRTAFLIKKVSPLAHYRRILEGSPNSEGAEELYSQYMFLDKNIIGHDTITGFRSEFCKIGYFNEIVGYKNQSELHRRIDPYTYRVREAECLDLPERIYKRWHFDLGNKERQLYDDFKKKKFIEFGENMLEESLAMVKSMRLQQICSGWFPNLKEDPETGKRKLIDYSQIEKSPARFEALKILLKHIGPDDNCLIFTRFRPDLLLLQKELGDKAVCYFGGIPQEVREAGKVRFQDPDDPIKYFIGQQRTAGIGHTLTQAKHVIFYCNDASLRFRKESEKRAHRKGQKYHVTVWDLLASKTQDKKIIQTFQAKDILSRVIMQDPDEFFLVEE